MEIYSSPISTSIASYNCRATVDDSNNSVHYSIGKEICPLDGSFFDRSFVPFVPGLDSDFANLKHGVENNMTSNFIVFGGSVALGGDS